MASDDETIGIKMQTGGDWVIRDNIVRGRQTGIEALSDGVVEGNRVEDNGVGLSQIGDPPAMSGNRICDNTFGNVRPGSASAAIDQTTNEICPDE